MKNMAVLDENGVVLNVVVCADDEPETVNLLSYSDDNPAFIGGDYVGGFFYPPQPFPSWLRVSGEWVSPIPYPSEEGRWQWSEEDQQWQD